MWSRATWRRTTTTTRRACRPLPRRATASRTQATHRPQNSKDAKVFCLVHKMDLIAENQRDLVPPRRLHAIVTRGRCLRSAWPSSSAAQFRWTSRASARPSGTRRFTRHGGGGGGDDTHCAQAWSSIVVSLIPNVDILEKHLSNFSNIADADEVAGPRSLAAVTGGRSCCSSAPRSWSSRTRNRPRSRPPTRTASRRSATSSSSSS